jgi:hypothetical protein
MAWSWMIPSGGPERARAHRRSRRRRSRPQSTPSRRTRGCAIARCERAAGNNGYAAPARRVGGQEADGSAAASEPGGGGRATAQGQAGGARAAGPRRAADLSPRAGAWNRGSLPL